MSSLRRGHANLLCIVPILADDLFRGSSRLRTLRIFPDGTRNTYVYGTPEGTEKGKQKISLQGPCGNRTRDLSDPNGESYL